MILDNFPYYESVVGFMAFTTVLHTYLSFRQLKALNLPKPPAQIAHLYEGDEFKKKQAYSIDKQRFSIVHGLFDSATNLAFLAYSFYPQTWSLAGDILGRFGRSGETQQTLVWMLVLSVISTVIGLPWSIYSTFVLEEKHGFNKMDAKTFVLDMIKSFMLSLILGPPIISAIVYILSHTGVAMAFYLWSFIFTLSIVMMTVYPVFIAPLFNKYTPLEDGTLRKKIESLAASLGFPLKKLFVVDGSKRSAHSNAYMYGFFNNKRIVLYDTLIQQCTEDQVTAVLAHELGHWKLRHTPVLFVASQALLAAQLSLFALMKGAPGLYESFGFSPKDKPVFAALLLFNLIIGPVDEILGLLQNFVSRTFEFQADRFGCSLGRGADLKAALLVLDKENKGPPNVDPLYSAYHYSHPPLPERLAAIDIEMKKKS